MRLRNQQPQVLEWTGGVPPLKWSNIEKMVTRFEEIFARTVASKRRTAKKKRQKQKQQRNKRRQVYSTSGVCIWWRIVYNLLESGNESA